LRKRNASAWTFSKPLVPGQEYVIERYLPWSFPDGWSRKRYIRLIDVHPLSTEIIPWRIHGFDQSNFLAAPPCFDFLLAIDGRIGIDEFLIVDEPCQVISTSESGDEFVLVLEHTMRQVARDAGVEDVRAWSVRHDVNEEASILWHAASLFCCVIPKRGAFTSRVRDLAWSLSVACEGKACMWRMKVRSSFVLWSSFGVRENPTPCKLRKDAGRIGDHNPDNKGFRGGPIGLSALRSPPDNRAILVGSQGWTSHCGIENSLTPRNPTLQNVECGLPALSGVMSAEKIKGGPPVKKLP
jgi:hypothetical protein